MDIQSDIQAIIDTVQHNCHISDARHAGNYTLCVYLLKMREFYRWEQKHRFSDKLSTDTIGNWLSEREALWEKIEEHDFRPIELGRQQFDPFDAEAINRTLETAQPGDRPLVYSGGYGVKDKPHFFLAELEQKKQLNGYSIYISGREFARDLTSPPAMSQQQTIYIRRESFRRMIWERLEEWRWNKPANAMARAIACYDFAGDLEGSLNRMTDKELDAAVLHEIGEIQAGETLPGWQAMMQDISFTKAEIMARAVRDHYADTLHTLPVLLEKNEQASMHFYFANLTNMRKHIFPALMQAYQQWCDSGDVKAIEKTVNDTLNHWRDMAQRMIELHRQDKQQCAGAIEALVDNNILSKKQIKTDLSANER